MHFRSFSRKRIINILVTVTVRPTVTVTAHFLQTPKDVSVRGVLIHAAR